MKHAQFYFQISSKKRYKKHNSLEMYTHVQLLCVIIKFVDDYKSVITTDAPELPKTISNFIYY